MDALSRIGIFIEVARQESFAQAGRELGITTSAASKQVQNLEQELQAKLLNRTTRRVSLTEEGALFFERASRAMDDLKEARDQINELRATPRGALRISVPTALGTHHLKYPIAEFARTYPEVLLDVQFEDRIIDLASEGFDMVLRIGVLPDSSMIARKLASCPIHMCASANYLARYGEPETPEDLAHHHVLAYTRNKGAHEWRYRDKHGTEGVVALTSNFKCDFAEMMVEAASQGIGIVVSPVFFIQEALTSGALQPILTGYTTWPERNLYAIFPPNRYLSTRLRLLVDHLDAYCKKSFS